MVKLSDLVDLFSTILQCRITTRTHMDV